MPRYKLSLEIVVEADSTDQAIRWLRRLLENTDMAEHNFVKESAPIRVEEVN